MYIRQLILCLLLCGQAWADTTYLFVTDDAYIHGGFQNKNYNYGVGDYIEIATGGLPAKNYRGLVGWTSLSGLLPDGSVWDSLKLRAQTCHVEDGGNVSAYIILKWWDQGDQYGSPDSTGVCYNDWFYGATGTDSSWQNDGIDSACDTCSFNRNNGWGADRRATAEATTNVTSVAIYYEWSIDTVWANKVIDGDWPMLGIVLIAEATTELDFYQKDYFEFITYSPRLIGFHHVPASDEETKGVFRNNLSGKSGKFEKRR